MGYVEMLHRSSFLGLLGGGRHSRIPSDTAWVWDGVEQKVILELAYGSDVRAIRLRKDLWVTVFWHNICWILFNQHTKELRIIYYLVYLIKLSCLRGKLSC